MQILTASKSAHGRPGGKASYRYVAFNKKLAIVIQLAIDMCGHILALSSEVLMHVGKVLTVMASILRGGRLYAQMVAYRLQSV